MGAHLSQPVVEKETGHGSCNGLHFGFASMQGWRTGMEDAHLAVGDLGGPCAGMSLFAVFDGHGGPEVARFCEQKVPDLFKKYAAACQSKSSSSSSAAPSAPLVDSPEVWGRALVRTFHGLDDMLREPGHGMELLEMRRESGQSGGVTGRVQAAAGALGAAQQQLMNKARESGRVTAEEAKTMAMQMAMLRRLEGAASAMQERQEESEDPSTAAFTVGATAVCVVMSEKHIVCANTGDSRAVLCRRSRVVPLSYDHKPNDDRERKRIYEAGGSIKETIVGEGSQRRTVYRVNGNLNLSRTIGDLAYKQREDLPQHKQVICATPDIIVHTRADEDEFFVVACDGIWEVKDNRQVGRFVRSRLADGKPIPRVASELIDSCLSPDPQRTMGKGADNMSVVVVRLREEFDEPAPSARWGFGFRGCFGTAAAAGDASD